MTVINPTVVSKEGIQPEEEGCLSIPGFSARVDRPAHLVVRGVNREGEELEVAGNGLLARILQHELDHLAGTLFVDRLHGLRRELIMRRVRKMQRAGKW